MERLRKRLESSKLDLHLAHSIFQSEQLRAEILHQGRLSRDTMVDLNLEAYTRHQDLQQTVLQSINDGRKATQQSFDSLQSGQSVLQQEVQSSHFVQQQNLSTLRTGQARMEQALYTGQAQTRRDIIAEASAITGHLSSYQHQTIAHLDHFKQEILDAVKAQSHSVCNASAGSVVNSPQTKRRQRALYKSVYHLQLLSHGLELLIRREICGWNFHIKTYRVIPEEDDRWGPFRSRDLASIQCAIREGVILPYDRDESGNSPIDLVVGYWACGATVFIEELLNMWAHAGFPLLTDNLLRMADTVTILWGLEQRDPTSGGSNLVRKWYKVVGLTQDVPDVVPEALADLPGTWSAEERFEVLSWFRTHMGYREMPGASGYASFSKIVCTFGADLHPWWRDWDGEDKTPLAVIICRMAESEYPEIHTELLQQWLEALYLANVDLEEYGRAEMDLLRKLRGTPNSFSVTCVPYLVAYGPTAEDWEFLEMHSGDIYAGLFWHMVEHPEVSIPGAWLDDEDQAVKFEDSFVAERQCVKDNRRQDCERREEYGRQRRFEKMQRQNGVDVDEDEEER
ncbi:hypothetical protein LTS10_005169 [Elasticomyces elasticus]|nr:hypothetical protein LTS10_005169 [Elasticomyces elasticus]